ncbi:hypothetical protein RclHR1_14000001 [Rhizophagus clarus]|uniref:Uncharacterized protein n=1 Tax=Rhizophagus clarus TaxID=94130 RepID=A0A2Z6QBK1_9GLOM|nr:hypothetical protein RclHR1_14000001 [Rhizophagus clarus]GES79031.1 hypothetical protein GLOIN_2v1569355 [Rhizophagus clarus]
MAENSTCKYFPGIYYTCQKCLCYFKLLQENSFKSNERNIKEVQINNEVIVLNDLPREDNERKERNYNDNEIEDEDDNDIKDDDNYNNKGDNIIDDDYDDNKNYEEENNNNDEEIIIIEEIKIQLVVKKNYTKTLTAKTLTIQPANYKNIIDKINLTTNKILEKETKSRYNYTISYKAVNACGPSNTLKDELDFQEFINEYQKVISSGKKMLKKKSRSIREDDLSKEEKTRFEVIANLVEMYKCNLHSTPCFIQDGWHLQLNPSRLQL